VSHGETRSHLVAAVTYGTACATSNGVDAPAVDFLSESAFAMGTVTARCDWCRDRGASRTPSRRAP
jgi:hypothetical protein